MENGALHGSLHTCSLDNLVLWTQSDFHMLYKESLKLLFKARYIDSTSFKDTFSVFIFDVSVQKMF